MSSNDISLVSPSHNGVNSQLFYQEDPSRFTSAASHRPLGDPGPKTRELAGFIDDKLFASSASSAATNRYFSSVAPAQHHRRGPDFTQNVHRGSPGDKNWSVNGEETSGDDSDGQDEEEDDDVDEELDDDEEVDGRDDNRHSTEAGGTVGISGRSTSKHNDSANAKMSNGSNVHRGGSHLEKVGNENGRAKDLSPYVMVIKDGGGSLGRPANAGVTIANPDSEVFYSQCLQTAVGSGGRRKEFGGDSGCGFNGSKDGSVLSNESGDLRAILSDPVTGSLMDDAMILLCGHSFGQGGLQHALITKSCYTCSRPVRDESISPNLALRAAVQAYRREEELQIYRLPKRRKERYEERGGYGDPMTMDPPMGRGVQFPFSVCDRVIIKGNKRTPERFVGREAIVTTQCLNGWYVVKTLDNAESVKLQYRSLAKVKEDQSSKHMSTKMTPDRL